LQAIVQLARDYESRRTPLAEAMQMEYYMGLAFYRDLAEGRIKPKDLRELMASYSHHAASSLEQALVMTGLGVPLVLGESLKEYEEYHAQIRADMAQPMWARTTTPPATKRFLNQLLAPVHTQATPIKQHEVAFVRLAGCAAAIMLHQQRTGSYPATLESLNLGEMSIDPFTGKPFVYRRDAKRGFQLYSLGQNKTDEGGCIARDMTRSGDLTPLSLEALPEAQRPKAHKTLSPPVWIR
ncbi:MAG: hypothetical protein NZM28_00900, partial [Fimbriimonadales bacterium]|nr:hypothetical protein [Fimbriimonadales bacterium]